MNPSLVQDLIGHPVTYSGAEGLVHDHPLDRSPRTLVEESEKVGEGWVGEVGVET